ncbi:DedA family protein [Novosphingobium decolorationis]|uniref:DedA family protein n=1 Tax=Novosphingobium decolorationis TaxID=2698673 RepID=A0ABX8E0A2_9SPHN|nr:DedA family protein [Novosphingobium decolorationis]QVM82554.1 DedA family protein [Novosphingobium decolorationis]
MSDLIYDVIREGGYFGVFVLMALENIFPPIPSELIMGLGGLAVAREDMSFLPLLCWATAGATLGNYVLFLGAHRMGYERLHPFIDRWGRWLTLDWNDIERSSRFLKRHGHWVVLGLRLLPMFRTVVSIPAGLAHMGHVRFLAFTAIGTGAWNVVLIIGGGWLGRTLQHAEDWLSGSALALIAVALVWYVWRIVTWRRGRS